MFVLVSERLVPSWPEIATLISAYEVMLKPFNESHVENLLKVFSHIHRRSNVLIVDRARTARKIIREMFGRLPFNVLVDETDTGAHALRAVKATHFDVVLVDAEVDDGMGAEARLPRRPRRAPLQGHPHRRRGPEDVPLGARPVRPLRLHPEAVQRRRARKRPARRAEAVAALSPQRPASLAAAGRPRARRPRRRLSSAELAFDACAAHIAAGRLAGDVSLANRVRSGRKQP